MFGNGVTDEGKTKKKKTKTNHGKLSQHKPRIDVDVELNKGDKYMLLDVGGGTVDVACHEIMDEFSIAEVLHPSGA